MSMHMRTINYTTILFNRGI